MKHTYALLAMAIVLGTGTMATRLVAAEKLLPIRSHSGKVMDASLRKLAPESGVISDAETWNKLRHAWFAKPHERLLVPDVDFQTNLVLVGTVPGPNRVIMHPELHEDGDVRFIVAGTKIGGPGFGFLLMTIERAGVKSVNGTPLQRARVVESITVTVVGTLKSGVVAIGGETTGTTISAKGATWELELSHNDKLRQAAEDLNGKPAIVQGSLERRAGVEIKDRWIVHVGSLQAIVN